jgi:hypothetical protein
MFSFIKYFIIIFVEYYYNTIAFLILLIFHNWNYSCTFGAGNWKYNYLLVIIIANMLGVIVVVSYYYYGKLLNYII